MSETKPKRRRRLATPPPEETSAPTEDVYDQGVRTVFDDLKTAKCDLPFPSEEPTRSGSVASANTHSSLDDSSVIDLDPVSLTEVREVPSPIQDVLGNLPAALDTANVECEPSSPPPPAVVKVCTRRLNRGVKAALDKLTKSQDSMRYDFIEDHYRRGRDLLGETDSSTPLDDSDTNVKIRVRMPSGIQRYVMKSADTLFSLREEIARRESTTPGRVSLFYNDTAVTATDTVQSLGLTVADTVEVYLLAEDAENSVSTTSNCLLTIKVQGKGGQREVVKIDLAPDEPMEVLMKKFAETKGLNISSLKFHFDGEELSTTCTPSSLDMEDGDCVDVTGY